MTWVTCDSCGRRLTKADAIVSRHSGRAWCKDAELCALRAEKRAADAREHYADTIAELQDEWTVA